MDYWWWREQEGIDLEVARSALEAAEAVLEEEDQGGGGGGGNWDRGGKLMWMG